MNPCDQHVLTLLVAGLLDESEARTVRTHLESCPACRAHHAEMQRLCERLGEPIAKVPTLPTPPQFHEHLRQRLRTEAAPTAVPAFLVLLRSWFTRPGFIVAAAAGLLAILCLWRFQFTSVPAPERGLVQRAPVLRDVEQPELASTSTALAYHLALTESFEALERLLEQNAARSSPSGAPLLAASRGDSP